MTLSDYIPYVLSFLVGGITIPWLIRRISYVGVAQGEPRSDDEALYFYELNGKSKFNEVITLELCKLLDLDSSSIDDDLSEITSQLNADDKIKLEEMSAQLGVGKTVPPIVIFYPKQQKYYECTGIYRPNGKDVHWIEIWFKDVTRLREYFQSKID